MRAIGPVLVRFAEHLSDTNFSLVLADRDGRVVQTFAGEDRVRRHLASLSIDEGFVLTEGRAGTNGIGTVLEERRPLLIMGDEHYSAPLRHLVCAGTPIHSPITGRLEGVLDLACPRREWSKLICPSLAQLRHDVERELAAKASLTQRLVFERFTARCRRTSAAVIAVSEDCMITNAAAAGLVSPADQGMIWAALSDTRGDGGAQRITLSNGSTIDAKSQVIRLGGSIGGHLVELARHPAGGQPHPRRSGMTVTVDSKLDGIVPAMARRLMIVGERGAGKLTAAMKLHRRFNGEGRVSIVSCELSQVADGQSWLAELEAHLRRTEETIILRHVDLLSEPVARAVVALVDRYSLRPSGVLRGGPGVAPRHGPNVMATASDRFVEGWAGVLQEAFGEQTIQVPPLRDRRTEFPTLASSVLKDIAPGTHLSGLALAALQNYDWPGNFVQLRLVLIHAAETAGGPLVGLEHLPREIAGSLRGPRALSRIEELQREAIIAALRETRGNKARAAEVLGMSRSTFYRRLRQLRLDPSA